MDRRRWGEMSFEGEVVDVKGSRSTGEIDRISRGNLAPKRRDGSTAGESFVGQARVL